MTLNQLTSLVYLQVGAFSVLKELAIVLPHSVADHVGSPIPRIKKALRDKSSTSILKIEAFTFTRLVLASQSSTMLYPYIKMYQNLNLLGAPVCR